MCGYAWVVGAMLHSAPSPAAPYPYAGVGQASLSRPEGAGDVGHCWGPLVPAEPGKLSPPALYRVQ